MIRRKESASMKLYGIQRVDATCFTCPTSCSFL